MKVAPFSVVLVLNLTLQQFQNVGQSTFLFWKSQNVGKSHKMYQRQQLAGLQINSGKYSGGIVAKKLNIIKLASVISYMHVKQAY